MTAKILWKSVVSEYPCSSTQEHPFRLFSDGKRGRKRQKEWPIDLEKCDMRIRFHLCNMPGTCSKQQV